MLSYLDLTCPRSKSSRVIITSFWSAALTKQAKKSWSSVLTTSAVVTFYFMLREYS